MFYLKFLLHADLVPQETRIDGLIPYSQVLAEVLNTGPGANKTRTVRIQARPFTRTIEVQSTVDMRDSSTQTDPVQIIALPTDHVEKCNPNVESPVNVDKKLDSKCERREPNFDSSPCKKLKLSTLLPKHQSTPDNSDGEDDSYQDAAALDTSDSSYHPNDSHGISGSSDDIEVVTNSGPIEEKKFVVFESQLMLLLRDCPLCSRKLKLDKRIIGSLVRFDRKCRHCHWCNRWDSQPFVGNYPAGNVLISCSILFSGAAPTKALRMFQHMNVAAISATSYFKHQAKVLMPVIVHKWEQIQQVIACDIGNKDLVISGDGRCDSMGHCAKFGTYTTMDAETGLIIDIQLNQSSEVGGSYHMEVVGFRHSMAALKDLGLNVTTVVTDRHPSIRKIMKTEHPDKDHSFDAWHISKSIKSKLKKAGKRVDMQPVKQWTSSIVNHVYWSACSTPDGDRDVIAAKWLSLSNHIQNIHVHESDFFRACLHGQLDENGRRKAWIIPGTRAAVFLEKLIEDRRLVADIKQISPKYQTSHLEGFHSVINHFAPKMIGYGYKGMLSRVLVAVLHYNENAARKQAVNKHGEKRYKIAFPKYKQGGYTVKKVTTQATFEYVHDLTSLVFDVCAKRVSVADFGLPDIAIPAPLCATYEHPDKLVAVQEFRTRFGVLNN